MSPGTPSSRLPVGGEPALGLAERVRLAHARIATVLEDAGLRGLHVKGYAASPGVYTPHRTSSDVDLLVPPADASEVCRALAEHGWARVTDFSEGSIFRHAATFWHDHLGYVDVHRLFPGLGSDPEATFARLWAERSHRVIAGRTVPVPSLPHQRLVVVVHAARDPNRGARDVEHLRATLSTEQWQQLREQAQAFGAGAAWHVATGEEPTTGSEDAAELRLFQALSAHESGMDLFATRWASATGLPAKAALVWGAVGVNRPHLRMRLGRPLRRGDVTRAQLGRIAALARWAWNKGVHRDR
ncbi:nucleotidyltransferase family protein [Micrococcus sp.]|uniref:nucleotidyltransferase family protein n=1 Tax=Micrococcus sp. TaxID=1271 RepID=UPI002A908B57|nr:nucleotidyltransferase family protein [Micrococcus sp.]MDY6054822.1 nucleotidyltransferase family protein [Micrococcus sp.]